MNVLCTEMQQVQSMKVLPAIETRGLAWLAFARRCCGVQLPRDYWDASAFALAAESLAMQPPYVVDFKDIKIQVETLTCHG